jgi:hypothetical protein
MYITNAAHSSSTLLTASSSKVITPSCRAQQVTYTQINLFSATHQDFTCDPVRLLTPCLTPHMRTRRPDSEASSEQPAGGAPRDVWDPARPLDQQQTFSWSLVAPKPKKTKVERVAAREERSVTDKNRKKRAAKREKELALRELQRASL